MGYDMDMDMDMDNVPTCDYIALVTNSGCDGALLSDQLRSDAFAAHYSSQHSLCQLKQRLTLHHGVTGLHTDGADDA